MAYRYDGNFCFGIPYNQGLVIYHLSVVCLIKDLVIFNQNELKLLISCHDVFLLCRLFPSAFS